MSAPREKKPFLTFLADGLKSADNGLGDRSKYIGSSDIGQCLRKSYLSKLIPEDHVLEQLIVFERGHVGEGVIEKALKAKNLPYKTQVTIDTSSMKLPAPFNPHLDFVVDSKKSNELIVIECKTTASLPDSPRDSWVSQTQLQMGFLGLANPDKKIRGYIIAFDLNSGQAREWPCEPSSLLFEQAKARGAFLWDALQDEREIEGEPGELCGFCPFKAECGALRNFGIEAPADIAEMAKNLKRLQPAEKEAKALKDQIKLFMQTAGLKKITAGDLTITLSNRSKETVDVELLKECFPDAYRASLTEGGGYSALKIA